jgi:hypothetical protein
VGSVGTPILEDLDPSTGTDAPTPPTTTGPSSYTLNWEEPLIIQTAASLVLLGACAQLGWAGVILRVIPQATTTPNPIGLTRISAQPDLSRPYLDVEQKMRSYLLNGRLQVRVLREVLVNLEIDHARW